MEFEVNGNVFEQVSAHASLLCQLPSRDRYSPCTHASHQPAATRTSSARTGRSI
jgi:hypothetical protein